MRSWLGTVSAAGLACAIGCHGGPPVRPFRPPAAVMPEMALSSTPLPAVSREEMQNRSERPTTALAGPAKHKAPQQATSVPTLPVQDPSQLPAAPLAVKSAAPSATVVVTARGGERQPAGSSENTFDHATDYAWLTGELYYVQSHHCWRLRFAAAGVEDRCGGVVTLTGDGLTPYARDGQIVRVEGTLLNPESTEPQPAYWVRHLTVLKEAPTDGN